MKNCRVLIKGAGDLGTGVAHRLWRSGLTVILLELPWPLAVRRTVSFASAVYEGVFEVEGVTARLCRSAELVDQILLSGEIPLLVDPGSKLVKKLKPAVLVDAVMAKRNTGTLRRDAPLVIGLGPGFTAGRDVHAVVETKRGHNLGRVIEQGPAAADTGIPGEIAGFDQARLLRAPAAGKFLTVKEIGDQVLQGETVAYVGGTPLAAGVKGVVRGLLYPGLEVKEGMKVGDVDPRGNAADFLTISDKARAVAGAVLEAVLNRCNKS